MDVRMLELARRTTDLDRMEAVVSVRSKDLAQVLYLLCWLDYPLPMDEKKPDSRLVKPFYSRLPAKKRDELFTMVNRILEACGVQAVTGNINAQPGQP